jgi:hypothetical protein
VEDSVNDDKVAFDFEENAPISDAQPITRSEVFQAFHIAREVVRQCGDAPGDAFGVRRR